MSEIKNAIHAVTKATSVQRLVAIPFGGSKRFLSDLSLSHLEALHWKRLAKQATHAIAESDPLPFRLGGKNLCVIRTLHNGVGNGSVHLLSIKWKDNTTRGYSFNPPCLY